MVKRLLHGVALLLIFLSGKPLFAQDFSIILGRPTDSSVTASVMFRSGFQFYLAYDSVSGSGSLLTPIYYAAADIPEEVDLTGLRPDTRYYYRLYYKRSSESVYRQSDEYAFRTQRPPGSSFTFTIESDEHLYDKKGIPSMYNVTLANQAADNPDFMFSLGDIFGDDHNADSITAFELDTLHRYYRPFLGRICHSIPFYVCLGNHEGEKEFYLVQPPPANNMGIPATLARKKYYPNPFPNRFYSGNDSIEANGIGQPENYYAWEWGDALFVVLDVYRDMCDTSAKPRGWAWSLGLPQYKWLKRTLENSRSKYKFVFAHHVRGEGRGGVTNAVVNEWGGYQNANGIVGNNYTFPQNRPAAQGWTKPIHQLFVDNKVSVFFQGHDHVFAHEVLDSIVYQSTPMAADSTYEIGWLANAAAYVSDTLPGTGHLRVQVSPYYVKVDFVRAYLPADTFGIRKNREVPFSYYVRAKNTYTFIGNGNWSSPDNWIDKVVPPAALPAGYFIYIDPVENGSCTLNVPQRILPGGNLMVNPDKKFIVPSNISIQ